MSSTISPAFGWNQCAHLANDFAEVIVTLEVGPRILSYKTVKGENALRTFPDQLGKAGEPDYKVRGGHRMWIAPEGDRTYQPDNVPVKFTLQQPGAVTVANPADAPSQLRKEMTISLAANSSSLLIEHRATNEGTGPVSLATWGLTIVRPGGWQLIPQPPLEPHDKNTFLPDRVVVPWKYTDLSDDRWKIGRQYWRLTPKQGRPAAKLGFAQVERWIAYILPDALFIKSFQYERGATYPDLGCNYETYTENDFLELETLGPMRSLQPGESASHTETWHLFDGAGVADALDEAAITEWLNPYLKKTGIH